MCKAPTPATLASLLRLCNFLGVCDFIFFKNHCLSLQSVSLRAPYPCIRRRGYTSSRRRHLGDVPGRVTSADVTQSWRSWDSRVRLEPFPLEIRKWKTEGTPTVFSALSAVQTHPVFLCRKRSLPGFSNCQPISTSMSPGGLLRPVSWGGLLLGAVGSRGFQPLSCCSPTPDRSQLPSPRSMPLRKAPDLSDVLQGCTSVP